MSRGQAASDGMPTHHCRGTRPSSRPTLVRFSCEIGEEIAARCSDAQVYAGSRSKSAERKRQETLRWTVPRREANSQSGVSSDKTSLSSNDSVDLKTRAPLPCPTVVLSPPENSFHTRAQRDPPSFIVTAQPDAILPHWFSFIYLNTSPLLSASTQKPRQSPQDSITTSIPTGHSSFCYWILPQDGQDTLEASIAVVV